MAEKSEPSGSSVRLWHVLHLFYRVEHGQWALLSSEERIAAKTQLSELIQEIRTIENTQLLVFPVVTPKADLGFVLVTSDLQTANVCEKKLSLGLGADVLQAVYSLISIGGGLAEEEGWGLPEISGEWFSEWDIVCFYSLSSRAQGDRVGQHEAKGSACPSVPFERDGGRDVNGWVTSAVGLDDADWAVTLFGRDTKGLQTAVREARRREHGLGFETGECYLGVFLPLDEVFRRLLL